VAKGDIILPLAQYKSIKIYEPRIGDFVIWHGWFRHHYGIINGIDSTKGLVLMVVAGLPFLLLTMDPHKVAKNTISVPISKIKNSWNGTYAIYRHPCWYI